MTKATYTHIEVLLDRSGSMQIIKEDAIGGFNNFLTEQQKTASKDDTFSFSQFNTTHTYTYNFGKISEVPLLDDSNFTPSGGTAYIDAAVDAIKNLGSKLALLPENERPGKVVFVIITDGAENSSRKYKKADFKNLVTEHSGVYKWEFVFLGANMDAVQEAATYGISVTNSMTYGANEVGARKAFSGLSRSLNTFKAADLGTTYASSGAAFTSEERSASMGGTVPPSGTKFVPTANTPGVSVKVSVSK